MFDWLRSKFRRPAVIRVVDSSDTTNAEIKVATEFAAMTTALREEAETLAAADKWKTLIRELPESGDVGVSIRVGRLFLSLYTESISLEVPMEPEHALEIGEALIDFANILRGEGENQ